RLSTDDGFAWDWSPHGVMVARGDTVFFCKAGGDEWTPVHRSSHGSAMTVNYRGGFFFVLEELSLRTAVIDAETLDRSAEIDPPPRAGGVHLAFLVTSTDNVLLLLSRDGYRSTFTHAYRAHRPRQDGPVQWEQVKSIGDRAVFVDGAHGFTVRAGGRVRRNCVYVSKTVELDDDGGMARVVAVSPLNDLRKVAMAEGGEALRRCKVEPVWGTSHWIMCNHGPSPSLGTNSSNLAL
uniref:KIB1-4 beta-propeller domain-containing protein n=2 Tax=Aegilops tauschii subsp. strangulata TaxID=200361 RepID=A0A453QWQ0_AEGTS